MNCFPELTYAIYADGELAEAEARRVRNHLAMCSSCRDLVTSLRAENVVLTNILQQSEKEQSRGFVRPRSWFGFFSKAGAVVAVATLMAFSLNWVEQQLPTAAEWMNPFRLGGQSNLLITLVFFLRDKGAVMVSNIITAMSISIFTLLMFSGAALLWRYHRWIFRSGIGVLLLLMLVIPGMALEKRHSEAVVKVAANEIVDDSLLAAGDTVRVDGTINGNLFAFGRRVEVTGTVKGDLIAWAQALDIRGTVEGNIYGFGQMAEVRGKVGHSIYGWVQSMHLDAESNVSEDVVLGGGDVTLEGKVMRSLLLFAGSADVRGSIERHLTFYGGRLSLANPARVAGNLTAYVHNSKDVDIASGVPIGGKTETHLEARKSRLTRPSFYFWQIVRLLGALLVGGLALFLMPKFFHAAVQATGSWWRSLGLGFAILVGTPIAVVIVSVTLVGIPLGFMVLMVYLVGFYLSKIFVGAFVGRALLRSSGTTTRESLLALLLGLVVLTVVFQIPFAVGAVLHFLVFCFGFGAFAWQLFQASRPARE